MPVLWAARATSLHLSTRRSSSELQVELPLMALSMKASIAVLILSHIGHAADEAKPLRESKYLAEVST